VQGSSLESEGGSDSQRAAALGSSRQQQHWADRRQHQQHELQTPGDAAARLAAQLAEAQALPSRRSSGERGGLQRMELVCINVHVHMCAACAFKQV